MTNNTVACMVKKVFPLGTEIDAMAETPPSLFSILDGFRGKRVYLDGSFPTNQSLHYLFSNSGVPTTFKSRIKWQFLMGAYRVKRLDLRTWYRSLTNYRS